MDIADIGLLVVTALATGGIITYKIIQHLRKPKPESKDLIFK